MCSRIVRVFFVLLMSLFVPGVLPLPAADLVWTGGTDTDWNTAGNWDLGSVPAAADNVTIPSTANQPVLASAVAVTNLTLNAGAVLTMGAFNLDVTGDLSHSGTISGGASRFSVTGAASPLAGNITTAGGDITLSGTSTISGTVTLTSGGAAVVLAVVEGTTAGVDSLTVNAGAGAVTLGGNVGAATALGALTLTLTGGGTVTADLPAITTDASSGTITISDAASVLSQSGALVAGKITVSAVGDIMLHNPNNKATAVDFTGENLWFRNTVNANVEGLDLTGMASFQANTFTFTQKEYITSGGINLLNDTTWNTNGFDLTIDGTLRGGTLAPHDSETITVGGNFQPDTFSVPANSSVVLSGAAPRIGDGSKNFVFHNLRFTNAAAAAVLDVRNRMELTGDFIMTKDGTLDDQNNEICFIGDGAVFQNFAPGKTDEYRHIHLGCRGVGPTRVNLTTTVTKLAKLTIEGTGSTFRANEFAFTIGKLSFNRGDGIFELTGEQNRQVVTTMDTATGTVRYSNTAADGGSVRLANFCNLELTSTVANTWQVEKDELTIAGNLTVKGLAILDNSIQSRPRITFVGTTTGRLINSTTHANTEDAYVPGTSIIVFPNNNSVNAVIGSWRLYELFCRYTSGPAAKVIRFGNAQNPGRVYPNGADTIIMQENGKFIMKGEEGSRIELRPEAPKTRYWQINAAASNVKIDMEFSDLFYSKATPVDIPLQESFTIGPKYEDCPGWITTIEIKTSFTFDGPLKDSTGTARGVRNGKINTIRLDANTKLDGNFSGTTVTVAGYTVDNYYLSEDRTEILVVLQEGPDLDTGAVPAITMVNTSLKDDAELGFVVQEITTPMTPKDSSAPVIGYTLAVAGRNEVFVRFSEPVTGAPLPSAPAGYTDISSSKTDLQTNQEFVYRAPAALNASQVLTTVLTFNGGAGLADAAGNGLVSYTHRVTDVALGVVGDGVVEPVFARNNSANPSGGVGPGVITQFDGSEFLESEDITLQVHVNADASGTPLNLGTDVKVRFGSAIESRYKTSGGLWLPYADETRFAGLVPYPVTGIADTDVTQVVDSSDLVQYALSGNDTRLDDGRDIDVFFNLINLPAPAPYKELLAARILDETASNWYRGVRPWSWLSRNIVTQAGGVSILNNIINPGSGDRVSLHYELSQAGIVNVQIFDLAGGIVEVLQRGYQDAGSHSVSWDGRNRSGNIVARGIYFIRYVGPGGIDQIRKVLVIR